MDANELKNRSEDFDDTANLCGIDIDGPENLLELLYEDFAVTVGTFFHPINLDILLEAGIITPEIRALCITIENKVDYLAQNPNIVGKINENSQWKEVFALCQQVRTLKQMHNHQRLS